MSRPLQVALSDHDPYLASLKVELEPHFYSLLERFDLLRQVTENSLKTLRIAPPTDPNPITTITGPEPQPRNAHESIRSYNDLVSAQTISTYPFRADGETSREGDPICDRYGFTLFANRSFAVVADGCNWGEAPKRAAETAVTTMLNFLHEKHTRINTVGDATSILLRGFYRAHSKICEQTDPNDTPGTTTLIAGISFPIVTDMNSDWVFVYASVGDCKAFLVRPSTNEISDITDQNRVGQQHHADCGGRLGPTSATGEPDVRNLTTRSVLCQPGDLIFLVSDGVHDNLHPRVLGLKAASLGLNFDWGDPTKQEDVERFSTAFRVGLLRQIIGNTKGILPSAIVKKMINHGSLTTQSSRDWMAQNPGKRLPRDYERFPGKMDHTTCLCFVIGRIDDGRAARPAPPPPSGPSPHHSLPPLPSLPSSSASASSSSSSAAPSSAALASAPVAGGDASRALSSVAPTSQPSITSASQFVPIAVTSTLIGNKLTLYCKTVTHTKFQCVGTAHKIQLMTTGIHPVQLRPNEEIFGGINEIGQTYSRIIQLPQYMRIRNKDFINVHDNGTIVIQFDLEILPH